MMIQKHSLNEFISVSKLKAHLVTCIEEETDYIRKDLFEEQLYECNLNIEFMLNNYESSTLTLYCPFHSPDDIEELGLCYGG